MGKIFAISGVDHDGIAKEEVIDFDTLPIIAEYTPIEGGIHAFSFNRDALGIPPYAVTKLQPLKNRNISLSWHMREYIGSDGDIEIEWIPIDEEGDMP